LFPFVRKEQVEGLCYLIASHGNPKYLNVFAYSAPFQVFLQLLASSILLCIMVIRQLRRRWKSGSIVNTCSCFCAAKKFVQVCCLEEQPDLNKEDGQMITSCVGV
jgi:hypothetical protein